MNENKFVSYRDVGRRIYNGDRGMSEELNTCFVPVFPKEETKTKEK